MNGAGWHGVRSIALGLALLGAVPAAAAPSERPYQRTLDLVERLYLHPEEVEAGRLLRAAARRMGRDLHWLVVEAEGDTVYLRHGNGSPIGNVTVATLDTLPQALASLEDLVASSGYSYGDVDLRLSVLRGVTEALDRYSAVLSGDRLARFDVRLKGTLVGIGSTLSTHPDGLEVRGVVEGGPAAGGGLQPGDLVVRIDGVSTLNMPLREATRRLRGQPGTSVTLLVRRGAEVIEVGLARREYIVPNVEHRVLDEGVGYVRIEHFSQRTVVNLRVALAELRQAGALSKGLVIDLRDNTGGSMKDAAGSVDLFVEEGLLLRTVGADGGRVQNLQARMDARDSGEEPDVPVIVLVDGRTASGSEILAGSLVQLERAALLGSRTFGKGTVQKVYPIDEDVRLKLTVARYLLHGERQITPEGIVPDVVLGDISLDGRGVRFLGFDEHEAGVPWDAIVPRVDEDPSFRGTDRPPVDGTLELARRAVLRATAPTRLATVDALRAEAETYADEQIGLLTEALQARGIDWRPAQGVPADAPPPTAVVQVRTTADEGVADGVRVEVEVENTGTEPLARALVELRSPTFRAWNGLVVPVGFIGPGERGAGQVVVSLPPGVDPREDDVEVVLRADQRPPAHLGETVLKAVSRPAPRLSVVARLTGEGASRRVQLDVHNRATTAVSDLEVSFLHPGDLDVELVESAARVDPIASGGTSSASLGLRLGDEAPPILPLVLEVEAVSGTPFRARWPLRLPRDGEAAAIEPPRITSRGHALSAPVGWFELPVQVVDESAVDHVVVFVRGEKVAWAAGDGRRASLSAGFEVQPGPNSVRVYASDEHGLVTRRVFTVRGEAVDESATVDAAADASEP